MYNIILCDKWKHSKYIIRYYNKYLFLFYFLHYFYLFAFKRLSITEYI